MARYIDVVKCAEIISDKFNIPLIDLVDVLVEMTTADVAPKTAVAEDIFKEIEDFIKKQHNYMDELYFNSDDEVIQVYYGCKIGTYNHIKNFLAELKKKYTEGG